MKKVSITNRSQAIKQLLDIARKETLVVRTPEGDEFMLSLIDDFEFEIALQRRNQKLMAFLDERFREGHQEKGIPLEEVKKKLGLKSHDVKVSRRKAR